MLKPKAAFVRGMAAVRRGLSGPWWHSPARFAIAYAVAVFLLGGGDALQMLLRPSLAHDLKPAEVVLLPLLGLKLSWLLHVTLLGGAVCWIVALQPPSVPRRIRTLLYALPLAGACGVTFFLMPYLPFFSRLPSRSVVSLAAAAGSALLVVAAVWGLEKVCRPPPALVKSALALPFGVAAVCLAYVTSSTTSVLVRVPGALTALLAVAYLVHWWLPNTLRSGRWLLLTVVLPAVALMAASMIRTHGLTDMWYRVNAAVAHRTNSAQSLLFAKLFLLGPKPSLLSCDGKPVVDHVQPIALPRRWNVVLITVDALRSDHLALHGYDRITMPHLEQLAKNSFVFDTAYAATPSTSGSMLALWTGLGAPMLAGLSEWPPTLQSLLKKDGYLVFGSQLEETARIRAPSLVAARLSDVSLPISATGVELADAVVRFMADHRDTPIAVLAHFMEAHDHGGNGSVPRVFPERAWSRYDDALRYVDAQIGRILDSLAALGLWDSSVLIVTADHGEFLGEQGRLFHGSVLYEPVVRVPLVVHIPGREPRRVGWPASHIDLSSTAYRAATGKAWPTGVVGDDLIGLLDSGTDLLDRIVLIENAPSQRGVRWNVAIRKGRWKYVRLLGTEVEELFALDDDPGELLNVAARHGPILEQMRRALDETLRRRSCIREGLVQSAKVFARER